MKHIISAMILLQVSLLAPCAISEEPYYPPQEIKQSKSHPHGFLVHRDDAEKCLVCLKTQEQAKNRISNLESELLECQIDKPKPFLHAPAPLALVGIAFGIGLISGYYLHSELN